jgi:hypothetical protein
MGLMSYWGWQLNSGPVNKFEEYLLAFFMCLAVLAILTLPIQAVVECFQWLRTGEWPGYTVSSFLPVDALMWVYGDASDWVGLRKLASSVIQYWVSIPISIVGFLALGLANIFEGF